MIFFRRVLKVANSLVTLVVVVFLIVAGAYSAYALWDNAQVYAAVDDVQSELLKLKPVVEEDGGASFDELRGNQSRCVRMADTGQYGD